MVKKEFIFLISAVVLILFSLNFVFSSVVVKTANSLNYSVKEDVYYVFNISVNNTITNGVYNVTQVNITLPSSFTYLTNTFNATWAENNTVVSKYVFSTSTNSTNTILSWLINISNITVVPSNFSRVFFSFNASAATPGNHTILITTVNQTTGFTNETPVWVSVNDTTAVSAIGFNGAVQDGANLSSASITINTTVTDNNPAQGNIVIKMRLYNGTTAVLAKIINSTNSTGNWTNSSTFTGLPTGIYWINVTANDTLNANLNTSTIKVTLDNVAPNVIPLSPADAANISTTTYSITFIYNVTDLNLSDGTPWGTNISNCTLYVNSDANQNISTPIQTIESQVSTTLAGAGTYTWQINCSDYAGNIGNTSVRSFSIPSAGSSSTTGGSSSTSTFYWTNTQGITRDQFSSGFTKDYAVKYRTTFTIGTATHSMGVIALTSSQATINVSSTPQQKTLSIGEEWKVEVTNDNVYDISVKLNSIANNKANITIKSINEVITAASPTTPPATSSATTETTTDTSKSEESSSVISSWWFWVIVLAAVVIIVILTFLIKKKKRYYHKGF